MWQALCRMSDMVSWHSFCFWSFILSDYGKAIKVTVIITWRLNDNNYHQQLQRIHRKLYLRKIFQRITVSLSIFEKQNKNAFIEVFVLYLPDLQHFYTYWQTRYLLFQIGTQCNYNFTQCGFWESILPPSIVFWNKISSYSSLYVSDVVVLIISTPIKRNTTAATGILLTIPYFSKDYV